MKLKKLALIAIFIAVVSLVTAQTTVAVDEPGMIDVRSLGMGGTHIVDTNDFYTLLKNPAGLAFTGKKNMISVIAVNVGGPLDKVPGIIDDLNMGKQVEDIIPAIVADGMNVNLNLGLDGPICFGKISETGFGWGFFETVNVDANIPSITLAKLTAKVEMGFVMGFGFKFDLGAGTSVSVGASGEAFAQIPRIAMQDSLTNILDSVQEGTENLPFTSAIGLSCDVGAQVRLLNFIDAAIVWEDIFSPYFTKTTTLGEVEQDPSVLYSDFGNPTFQAMNFRVGAGVNVFPNGALGGLISSLKVQLDIKDFGLFFRHFIDKELSALERSPWLNFSAGVEAGLMSFIYARLGYSDGFLSLGASVKLGALNLDAAIYTRELGRTPGANNQLNVAVSLGLFY